MEVSLNAYQELIQIQWESRNIENDPKLNSHQWNTQISAKMGEIATIINDNSPDQTLLNNIIIVADLLRSWYWTSLKDDFNEAVKKERKIQDELWGEQEHSRRKWFMIAAEEAGEIAQAITETETKEPHRKITQEIIQLYAVLQAWVTSHDWFQEKQG